MFSFLLSRAGLGLQKASITLCVALFGLSSVGKAQLTCKGMFSSPFGANGPAPFSIDVTAVRFRGDTVSIDMGRMGPSVTLNTAIAQTVTIKENQIIFSDVSGQQRATKTYTLAGFKLIKDWNQQKALVSGKYLLAYRDGSEVPYVFDPAPRSPMDHSRWLNYQNRSKAAPRELLVIDLSMADASGEIPSSAVRSIDPIKLSTFLHSIPYGPARFFQNFEVNGSALVVTVNTSHGTSDRYRYAINLESKDLNRPGLFLGDHRGNFVTIARIGQTLAISSGPKRRGMPGEGPSSDQLIVTTDREMAGPVPLSMSGPGVKLSSSPKNEGFAQFAFHGSNGERLLAVIRGHNSYSKILDTSAIEIFSLDRHSTVATIEIPLPGIINDVVVEGSRIFMSHLDGVTSYNWVTGQRANLHLDALAEKMAIKNGVLSIYTNTGLHTSRRLSRPTSVFRMNLSDWP